MLANLIAANIKHVNIVPYTLDLTGLDWNVATDGAKLDIEGHGWEYHNDGSQQTIWETKPATPTSEAFTVNRIGEMLNITGEGWSVHTDQNVMNVNEGIGYEVATAHAFNGQMPGFIAHFVPAGETIDTQTQNIATARKTPFHYTPFGATCEATYGQFPSGTTYSTTCGADPELFLKVGDLNFNIKVADYCKYAKSGFIAEKGWVPSKAGTLAGNNDDMLEKVGI
jgi:hypothetical protein